MVINPGSTTTKIAIYDNAEPLFEKNLSHSSDELAAFSSVVSQFDFRKKAILAALAEEVVAVEGIDAVIGRGGLLRPIPSGVYEVNEPMCRDFRSSAYGEHASNLGGLLALEIASLTPVPRAYIADPVVVDEMDDVARISGHPLFPRRSVFHALNHKAVARRYAAEIGRSYEDMNLIVAHMGGGVSVAAHRQGRVVDVNNALEGDGPFSPERVGALPAMQVARLCFSGEYTPKEVDRMLKGCGGLVAHLGTNDMRVALQQVADGDAQSMAVVKSFCYAVSKAVGEMAVVLCGKADAILLTGGIAHSELICDTIGSRVSFIAPLKIYGGEDEMSALAANALNAVRGEVKPGEYGA